MRKYLVMNGYGYTEDRSPTASRRPFAYMGEDGQGIADTNEACRIGLTEDLSEFWLTSRPGGGGSGHLGYIRTSDPRYKRGFRRVPTREAVLIHLVKPGPYLLKDLLESGKNGGEH